MEPLLILKWADIEHPVVTDGLGDIERMLETLATPLRKGPWLLGERFSAADMLLSSPFQWFGDALPAGPQVRDWVDRCAKQVSAQTA